jgi:hypothetical protein
MTQISMEGFHALIAQSCMQIEIEVQRRLEGAVSDGDDLIVIFR